MKYMYFLYILFVFNYQFVISDEINSEKRESFYFDGTDDLIVVPNDSSINSQAMTIIMDFKVKESQSLKAGNNKTSQFLLFKKNPQKYFNEGIAIFYDEIGKNITAIVSDENRKQIYAYSPKGTIETNKWYSLIVSADSISVRLFLDNSEQKSNLTGFPLKFDNEPMLIGGRSNVLLEKEKYGGMFAGEIRNLMILNKSISQIGDKNFFAKKYNVESSIVLHFSNNEESGIVHDKYNLNNGVILRGRPAKSELNNSDYISISPNPTKSKTILSFILEHETDLKVVIRDISGREISKLHQGVLGKGTHKMNFSADSLESGYYVCYLEAGSFNRTASFIVVK